MTNVRKSLHRSKNRIRLKKRANQRAAKERRRQERAAQPRDHSQDLALAERANRAKISSPGGMGFRVTIECLADGERTSFTTRETPHGMTISASLCGAKVANVILGYRPSRHYLPPSPCA